MIVPPYLPSGLMPSSQVEFLLNQHLDLVSTESYGPFWNGDIQPLSSNAASDPSWWTENMNADIYSDEVFITSVHQESQLGSAGVSFETSWAQEAGSSSIEASFQNTDESSEMGQTLDEINGPLSLDIDSDPRTAPLSPDGSDCNLSRNSTTTSTASRSECDLDISNGGDSAILLDQSLCQEPHEKRKRAIPRLNPFECPHCPKTVYSKRQLRSHVQKCKEQPAKCDVCEVEFTRPQDLRRHRESSRCLNGRAPDRPFVCTCGKDYTRKDRWIRHVKRRAADSSKTIHNLQSKVGLLSDLR